MSAAVIVPSAIFADVTELSASFAVVTAPSPSENCGAVAGSVPAARLDAVIAPSAILAPVTEPSAIFSAVTAPAAISPGPIALGPIARLSTAARAMCSLWTAFGRMSFCPMLCEESSALLAVSSARFAIASARFTSAWSSVGGAPTAGTANASMAMIPTPRYERRRPMCSLPPDDQKSRPGSNVQEVRPEFNR